MYHEFARQARRKVHLAGLSGDVSQTLEKFMEKADFHWSQSRDMTLSIEQRRIARERALKNVCFVLDFVTLNLRVRLEL